MDNTPYTIEPHTIPHFNQVFFHTWLYSILHICEHCDKFHIEAHIVQRNTACATDDRINRRCLCPTCAQEDYDAFQELWEDYYASGFRYPVYKMLLNMWS